LDWSATRVFSLAALAALAPASTSLAGDASALVGTYTENEPCKADGSNADVPRVKITQTEIDSALGLCTILDSKREGNTIAVHVECKGPGGSPMLGDVNFVLRDNNTIDFSDQDQTYKAVLHKCP
jgi:hypothetical protein